MPLVAHRECNGVAGWQDPSAGLQQNKRDFDVRFERTLSRVLIETAARALDSCSFIKEVGIIPRMPTAMGKTSNVALRFIWDRRQLCALRTGGIVEHVAWRNRK